MSRQNYSNRQKETLQEVHQFTDVHSIVSTQFGGIKDTFIYNQPWWILNQEDSDIACFDHMYKLHGTTAGHSHAPPNLRREVVLGLANRLRSNFGAPPEQVPIDGWHGVGNCELGTARSEDNLRDSFLRQTAMHNIEGHPHTEHDEDGNFSRERNDMYQQPPLSNRTPIRPIYLMDLRTDENPAVPEGGFVKSAKLILTVSQQSIAWPREGYEIEVYNIIEGANEDATWFSPTGNHGNLPQDFWGITFGTWFSSDIINDGNLKGNVPGATMHYLPNPMHPHLRPNDKHSTFDGWDWKVDQGQIGSPGEDSNPHFNVCQITDFDNREGYWNPTIMVFPAYDPLQSSIEAWGGDSAWEVTHDGTMNPYDCPDSTATGWPTRASEVIGLTGCGGAVDIEDHGFVDFPFGSGEFSAVQVINYDGSNMIHDDENATFVHEWRMIHPKNYIKFHIPKFTNAGYTGSYTNLINEISSPVGEPIFTYATGPSGCFDGRGITFAVDLSDMARKAIAKKNQKLDILIKGEYKHDQFNPLPPDTEVGRADSKGDDRGKNGRYESHIALVGGQGGVFDSQTDCRNCAGGPVGDIGGPDGDNNTPYYWSTAGAQIATNFYAENCEAPTKQMILNFRGKGSTLDLQAGNIACQFIFGDGAEDYDKIFVNSTDTDMVNRLHSVFGKITNTDTFTISSSTPYEGNFGAVYDTDGVYKVSDCALNDFGALITVTGDNRLYPTIPALQRPTYISGGCIINGTYRIQLDDEYYIENVSGDRGFIDFYSMDVIPELYAPPPQGMGGQDTGGITGGGRDYIEIINDSDETNQTSGTYQVLEFQQRYSAIDNVLNERLRVKQKL